MNTTQIRFFIFALIPTIVMTVLLGSYIIFSKQSVVLFFPLMFGLLLTIILAHYIAKILTREIQQTALLNAQKEIRDANQFKADFIANLSHEIRTSMNGILGFTNLLLETNITPLQKTYLTTMQKSTFNLLTFANNIIDVSRLDSSLIKSDAKAKQSLRKLKNKELFTGKTILCVDDNIQNGNLILALLNQTDITIKLANSGFEALELTQHEKFNVILMDLRMPNMDGIETLNCIRQSTNPNQKTPAIAISAHITEDEQNQLVETGFVAVLQKPISKIELITAIHKVLLNEPNDKVEILKPEKLAPPQANDQIIDWDLAMMLTNGNRELAQEMLQLLLKSLTIELAEIKEAYEAHDFTLFLQRLHKLHGAVSYCGVPRLKRAITILETALKKKQHSDIEKLFNTFEAASKELLEKSQS